MASPSPSDARREGNGAGAGADSETSATMAPGTSRSSRMLTLEEVRADTSIFTPRGAIIFPRSDGSASYGPPNTVVPPASAREVNYFAVFKEISEDKRYRTWSKTVGSALAARFGLPKKPPQGDHWYLESFPRDYHMTEQRKGPKGAVRTDPYLFGSHAHRFRSGPEFFPHATWLLTDPLLLEYRCECKYCGKLKKQGEVDESHAMAKEFWTSERAERSEGQRRAARGGDAGLGGKKTLSRRNMATENSVLIRSQVAAPKFRGLPGIPIDSAEDRNSELGVMDSIQLGQSEGHRVGEVACCKLDRPIVDDEDSNRVIDIWPVEVVKRTFRVNVADVPPQDAAPWSQEHHFDLEGRVSQIRCYNVLFLGTDEKATVDEDRLVPGIAAKMPEHLETVELGDIVDHPWLKDRSKPVLNLINQEPRPPFKQFVVAFGWQWHALTLLRSLYTTTDEFSRESLKGPAPPVVSATADNNDASASATAAATSTTNNTGGPNRFLGGESAESHAGMVDDDDDFGRRRRGLGQTHNNVEEENGGLLDNNQYWQGAFFGLERIWVGDLVRLRLAEDDVKTMMEALAKGNDLVRAADRTNPQLRTPYLMRIKAIYRPANVTAEDTDDKCRVAGDVYRVIESEEPATSQAETSMDVELPPVKDGAPARSTFIEPIRPFHPPTMAPSASAYAPTRRLELSRSLPPSPYLPPGFAIQLVNRSTVDVVCSVQQLAGRLWCSLATSGPSSGSTSKFAYDLKAARQERLRQQQGHEDTLDDVRVTLSLAGIVAGAAKAMEVDTYKGYAKDRAAARRRAQMKGLGAMLLCFSDAEGTEEGGKKRTADDLDEDEVQSSLDTRKHPLTAREMEDERIRKESEVNATIAVAKAIARAGEYASQRSDNSPTATGQRERSSIPVPIPEADASASEETTTTRHGGGGRVPSKASSNLPKKSPKVADAHGPLPPGWQLRRSRQNPEMVYYANPQKGKTLWTCPTEDD